MTSLFGLDPATYTPHAVHGDDRTYSQTNCYVDCLVELVASAGLEPVAMLGGAAAVDLEHDQWTFFKPTSAELLRLYGIDVHEVQPYRGLLDLAVTRLAAGRTVMPEVDSFWLPDVASTAYRTEHVKSTIVVETVDADARVLRYFHNAGYHELSGEDFDGLFAPAQGDRLPTYVELVRFGARPAPTGEALRDAARALLRDHLDHRPGTKPPGTNLPGTNPVRRWAEVLEADLPGLLAGSAADYHQYAFHNPRMLGAAMELLATHVRWLLGDEGEKAAALLDDVVGGSKMLLFRLARQRAFDVAGLVGPMADAYADAFALLDELV